MNPRAPDPTRCAICGSPIDDNGIAGDDWRTYFCSKQHEELWRERKQKALDMLQHESGRRPRNPAGKTRMEMKRLGL